jgi:hypothetical protein
MDNVPLSWSPETPSRAAGWHGPPSQLVSTIRNTVSPTAKNSAILSHWPLNGRQKLCSGIVRSRPINRKEFSGYKSCANLFHSAEGAVSGGSAIAPLVTEVDDTNEMRFSKPAPIVERTS